MLKIQPFENVKNIIYTIKLKKSLPRSSPFCTVTEPFSRYDIGCGRIRSYTGDTFAPTNRGLKKLVKNGFYPKEFFKDIKNKKVLDIGCGGGKFVLNLYKRGAKAFGIDIASYPQFKKHPKLFKVADAINTGFADKTFDQIYSSWSIFTFSSNCLNLKEIVLIEAKRILKTGGKIRLAVVNPDEIQSLVRKVGGLKVSCDETVMNEGCIELTKV